MNYPVKLTALFPAKQCSIDHSYRHAILICGNRLPVLFPVTLPLNLNELYSPYEYFEKNARSLTYKERIAPLSSHLIAQLKHSLWVPPPGQYK